MKATSIRIHPLTRDKLKAISDKRKGSAVYPSKQVEIVTELINKLYDKEFKK